MSKGDHWVCTGFKIMEILDFHGTTKWSLDLNVKSFNTYMLVNGTYSGGNNWDYLYFGPIVH